MSETADVTQCSQFFYQLLNFDHVGFDHLVFERVGLIGKKGDEECDEKE